MVYREVSIMKMLRHPNIIRLYEVVDTEKVLFIIMEYAGGGEVRISFPIEGATISLDDSCIIAFMRLIYVQVLDFIVAHGRLQEKEARRFFRQIISALQYEILDYYSMMTLLLCCPVRELSLRSAIATLCELYTEISNAKTSFSMRI
jgi:serine/threonine protein kinase